MKIVASLQSLQTDMTWSEIAERMRRGKVLSPSSMRGALDAHTAMSTQALESQNVRDGLKDILLGPAQLYETLRGVEPSRRHRRQ